MSGPENRLESLNHARLLRDGKIRFGADEWMVHKDRRVRHGRAIAATMNAAQGSNEQTSLKRSTRAIAPDYFAGLREH